MALSFRSATGLWEKGKCSLYTSSATTVPQIEHYNAQNRSDQAFAGPGVQWSFLCGGHQIASERRGWPSGRCGWTCSSSTARRRRGRGHLPSSSPSTRHPRTRPLPAGDPWNCTSRSPTQRTLDNFHHRRYRFVHAGCVAAPHRNATQCIRRERTQDRSHSCNFIARFCRAILSRDKIASVTWHVAQLLNNRAIPFPIRAALYSVQLRRENAVNADCSKLVYTTKLQCATKRVTLAILSCYKVARQNRAIKLQIWHRFNSAITAVVQMNLV